MKLRDRAGSLNVEASAVVATYNRLARFGVALCRASGPWDGGGVAASVDYDVCVGFRECGDDDERECALFRSRLGKQ